MDYFLLQLAIVFLPGLIWARLDSRYAMKEKPKETELLIRSFMYGLATYAIVYAIYWMLGQTFSSVTFSADAKTTLALQDFSDEILVSLPVALVLGTAWVMATTRKWLTRILQSIGATNRYGDEDVWDFMLTSNNPETKFVHLRDFEKSLVYAGYVETYSETGKLRELVLKEVVIYDFAGKEVINSPRLYLARDPANIHIEFPIKLEANDDQNEK